MIIGFIGEIPCFFEEPPPVFTIAGDRAGVTTSLWVVAACTIALSLVVGFVWTILRRRMKVQRQADERREHLLKPGLELFRTEMPSTYRKTGDLKNKC